MTPQTHIHSIQLQPFTSASSTTSSSATQHVNRIITSFVVGVGIALLFALMHLYYQASQYRTPSVNNQPIWQTTLLAHHHHSHTSVEVNQIQLPTDVTSWQAQMARRRQEYNQYITDDAPRPQSRRERMAETTNGKSIPELLPPINTKRQPQNSTPIPPARLHPLVGSKGHTYYSERTLILYSFIPNDPEALPNMEFFIEIAVREHHAADYIFIIQQNEWRPVNYSALPQLPANARYIHFRDGMASEECSGLGPIGWLLQLQHGGAADPTVTAVQPRSSPQVASTTSPYFIAFGHYAYTMLVDSSMRGPWFPTWIDVDHPSRVWYAAYQYHLERHSPEMHLVGSTISCQWQQPHVQFGAIMIDRIGWNLIDYHRTSLLRCIPPHESPTVTALALSRLILESGGNIGSQMLAYQEVDFRLPSSSTCLDVKSLDPQYDDIHSSMIGGSHYSDPHELVFVKYTHTYKSYKSEVFSDWHRWEVDRMRDHSLTSQYHHRWTPDDFRLQEEVKSKEEQAASTNSKQK